MFIKNKKNINNNRKVILSIDDNIIYSFFAPIVSLLWNKFDYVPIIFVVWSKSWFEENPIKPFIVNYILKFNGNIKFLDSSYIKSDNQFDGYNLSVVAQLSRFCSSCIVNENDYCLTSDIDMLPLKKDYFYSQDMNKAIHLFYANGYHHLRYPICYIGMKSDKWNEVMELKSNDIYENIYNLITRYLKPYSDENVQWGYDETLFYKQVIKSPYYKNNCQMIDRTMYFNPIFLKSKVRSGIPKTLPIDRLDRSNWIFNNNIDKFIDAHCKRPGYIKDNWNEIRYLLTFVLNKEELKSIDSYYDGFMELLNEA